ncbi:uncharacterized protein LOC659172 isoform X1 [Tribolium castaneum]|uniref:E3 ubiquitin-protein ligase APD1-4 middle domain-containing protein n=2 Tax=Tribolium castaneum TaxID=7070 RepID=D6WKA4_TRICA|nr:PREDICTED: uncharacterized protein LOC659172 isoform X1 [Tribolium castaneum]EFA03967.1 hypothetical protein TcasGA2_TC014112 [Tribolium castaneum]|eukprot:XP_008193249.1 PREDICTED: uncharacterized protein LOC659172 isoform X1 [Tribolium castaneum]
MLEKMDKPTIQTGSRISHVSYYNAYKYSSLTQLHKMGEIHGAKRVVAFFLLTAVLPAILIIVPLYLRHSVFADVTYPVAESDVVAIVDGMSSVFCSSQTLRMNTTFNAFQLSGKPKLSHKRKHIRLKKSMRLPDDTLEYWGFFLLKGAIVKLRVCSRYEGSRILVVRGEKNLKTCGLLQHNYKKYGAKMDEEHNRVKVTFENAAEVIEVVDNHKVDKNTAAEDLNAESVDTFVKKRLNKGKKVQNSSLAINKTAESTLTHHKRHARRKSLQKLLLEEEEEARPKRDIAELDAHIAHGGNALNTSSLFSEDSSVSSFETDLLTCYDGQILLTQGFPPSHHCNNVQYLEKSNHMMTLHEVATDGYYYYIFYSDNDIYSNDIHAIFDIYKPTYWFANSSKGNDCINQTECNFPVSFLSDETVIVEVPTRDGIEHEGDDITLLVSTCHPRMSVYMIFPITVLFLILGCAFL